jgi:hypothetical protein
VAGTILWTDRERGEDACGREWFLHLSLPQPISQLEQKGDHEETMVAGTIV